MKEYAVRADLSQTGGNKPEAIEKTVNAMAKEGWMLDRVAGTGSNNRSNVYMFFSRDVPPQS
jgi:hypothetical protein